MPTKSKPLFVSPETRSVQIDRSTHVRNVAYRPEIKLLSVTFRNGDVYDYAGVDYATAVDLAEAKSVGSYLNSIVKPKFGGTKRKK
jgi:hypothetical protein